MLSWSWLDMGEIRLPRVFEIDTSDAAYRLYLDAIHHLEVTYTPEDLTVDVLTVKKPPGHYHSSFGSLVNLLADRYTYSDDEQPLVSMFTALMYTERASSKLDDWLAHLLPTPLSPTSMLDFILYAAILFASINRGGYRMNQPCICTRLREAQPDLLLDSSHSRVYQAAFLDLMVGLWAEESRFRRREKWSPMPWSQVSLQDSPASQPDGQY